MAKVQDVARFFIEIAAHQNKADAGDLMTNLRLQKLLYFAQGWHLARYGTPLFNANIEAWRHGPVVPEIYQQYKENGGRGIPCTEDMDVNVFTPDELELLLDVAREYASYSTGALVSLSHAPNAPWSHTPPSTVIPQNEIHAYFAGKEPLCSFDDILDGYPVEVL
ncbi:MAG: DUF4065 domain-containing protein [Clostridia bacterium]|nr:DUF4065 domain-containing protein [Clostridia bacterium]